VVEEAQVDDRELCEGLAASQPRAFEELYASHGRRLSRFAASMLAPAGVREADDAAEDVVYGLFGRWFRKPPTIDPSGLRAFLGKCVRNACIDYIRREMRETGKDPQGSADQTKADGRRKPAAPGVEGETDAERYELLKTTLRTLPERDQGILEMYYGRVMTPSDAAAELGMTLTAYKKAVHDAKGRLRAGMNTARQARRGVQGR